MNGSPSLKQGKIVDFDEKISRFVPSSISAMLYLKAKARSFDYKCGRRKGRKTSKKSKKKKSNEEVRNMKKEARRSRERSKKLEQEERSRKATRSKDIHNTIESMFPSTVPRSTS